MMKYSDEQKAQALQSMKDVGVKKTQELLNISIQTLYKWRNEAAGKTAKAKNVRKGKATAKTAGTTKKAATAKKADVAKALLKESDGREAAITRLEAENAKLREQNDKLRKALAALMD